MMNACAQSSAWGIDTYFSNDCAKLAECIRPHAHSQPRCECTHSQFFLHNDETRCVTSRVTVLVLVFWACVCVWSVFVAIRMWRLLGRPQLATTVAQTPKKKSGGHFQRCKWVNFFSILCMIAWCCFRVANVAVVSRSNSNVLGAAEFIAHHVMLFSFLFCVVEILLTIVVVLMSTMQLQKLTLGATPTQQLLLGGGIALLLITPVVVPALFGLEFISALAFAFATLLLVCLFAPVLKRLNPKGHNSAFAIAVRPVFASYKLMTIALAWCAAASVCFAAIETAVQFSPSVSYLSIGRFITTAAQHIFIAVFQFLVTHVANFIQVKHRRSGGGDTDSCASRRRESTATVTCNQMSDSPNSSRSFRARSPPSARSSRSAHSPQSARSSRQAQPVILYGKPSQTEMQTSAPLQRRTCSLHEDGMGASSTENSTEVMLAVTREGRTASGCYSATLPMRPSPLRNIARQASGSSGEEE